jgi:hypothetical protein
MKEIKFEDEEVKEEKRFPVRLKRGYVPADPTQPKNPATGWPEKLVAGTEVSLPIDEARAIIKLGIAERADEIPI